MKKILLGTVAGVLVIIVILFAYNAKRVMLFKKLGKWETVSSGKDGGLPWITFYWNTDSIGRKMAMFVPIKIENLPDEFGCQVDVGANLSMLYGNTLKPFTGHYPILQKKLNTEIIKKDTISYLADLHLKIGGIPFASPAVVIRQDFGDEPAPDSVFANTSKYLLGNIKYVIGTVGVDICNGKVLIIDYPRNRLCIVDSVPANYHTTYSDITLDNQGRPVFKMEYKGKNYKIAFDCGSSIFPILALQKVAGEFSGEPATDTISVSAWGNMISMIGRPMKDSFTLAGHKFGNVKVYVHQDAIKENIPYGSDGLTGNILFLDKILIIDFKNNKVGIF